MDLFEEYLQKQEKSVWVRRALTDSSYKMIDNSLADNQTNKELATYGDAVIKLCYSEILLDNHAEKNLSIAKEKYESDKVLVEKVAKHYQFLDKIKRDENDEKIPTDYNYVTKKNNNPHKYIATAVEAMIGAIYQETKDLKQIIDLLKSWMNFQ